MKNCYNLSLNFMPLRDDFVYPVSNLGKRVLHMYGRDILSDSCKKWIKESGLKFHKLFIFEDPGVDNVRIVHIDGSENQGKKFAVNWNIGSSKFIMEWFDVSPAAIEPQHSYEHPYDIFDESKSTLIESSVSAGPVLFNTSKPHSVMNLDENIRHGVTLRFFNNLSWEESVDFLSRYIIE